MDDLRFPLSCQIACIILTAFSLWIFAIARDPRKWRRLYQAMFSHADRFSINRNKVLDEKVTKYATLIAVAFLVTDAAVFVFGMTHRVRVGAKAVPLNDWNRTQEPKKFNGTLPDP